MGFDEAETTAYRNDKGVDVRGILKTNPLSTTKVAIQAKRWTANVGSSVVRDLRGSLRVADAEQGLIITPSDFTSDASEEAESSGKTPIALINGLQLVNLLIQYQVGVKQEQYTVPSIDAEYWSEVLGVKLEESHEAEVKKVRKPNTKFPGSIRAQHKGETYTGLLLEVKVIIAIHNTALGPALGGTRMWMYKTDEEALHDVLRLSRGMTYKAAVAGLNVGGGKAVIIGDPNRDKTEAMFRAFGRFVEGIAGRYITAEDVGTDVRDMEYVRMETKYVTGIDRALGGSGDPSPVTAFGVYAGIKAFLGDLV